MQWHRRGVMRARPNGHGRARRFAAALIPLGLILAASVAVLSPSASADVVASNIATLFPADACQGYLVPANVNQIDVEATGGGGFPGSGPGSPGGRGGLVHARLEVESGTTLWAVVGSGSGGNQGGGATHHGGAGGNSDKEYGLANAVQYGGGGGGASFLSTDSAHCGTSGSPVNTNDVLLVAGGGGGGGAEGGGSSNGGAGGDAGQPGGGSGQDCTLSFLFGCDGGSNGGGAGTSGGPGAGGADAGTGVNVGGPGASLGANPSGSGSSWTYTTGGSVHVASGFGGAGGGGWYGGGQGGNNLMTFGGGGGGSSYASPGATNVSVGVDTTANPHITIAPVDSRRLLVATQGAGTGTVTSGDTPQTIKCGTTCKAFYPTNTVVTLTATAATTNPASRFAGWSGGGCSGTSSTCTVTMDVARSVTATFNQIHQLSFNVGGQPAGSGTITASPPGFPCGGGCLDFYAGTTVTLTATPDPVSVFRGWSTGGAFPACDLQTTPAPCTIVVNDRDLAVTAQFVQNVLTITKQGGGNGVVSTDVGGISCGDSCTTSAQFYPWGTVVTITATPDAGSTAQFLDGVDCSLTSTTCTVTMDGSPIGGNPIIVSFTRNPERLSVDGSRGSGTGTITSSDGRINCSAAAGCGSSSALYDQFATVTLTATGRTGTSSINSTFTGWVGDCTNPQPAATCIVTMDSAKSVQANFTLIPQYQLSVQPAGNSTGTVTGDVGSINCGSVCQATLYQGTTVTLTATTDPTTSHFAGWQGLCTNTQPAATCTVSMDAARTVIPTFSLLERQLTVTRSGTASGDGTVTAVGAFVDSVGFTCPTTCLADYDHGNVVTLSASPGAVTTFAGWTGPCTTTSPFTCNVTMDAAKTVNAEFDYQTATLTVSTAGTGTGTVTSVATGVSDGLAINCPAATCSDRFILNSHVAITATPNAADSVFTGWSSGCSNVDANSSGVCSVPLDQARSVTANFALNRLTVTPAGGGTGTVTSNELTPSINCGASCAHSYPGGTTITLTAAAAAGSTFAGWGGACAYRTTLSTCALTMTGATSVAATFLTSPRVTVILAGTGAQFGFVSTSSGGILCGQGQTVCSVALAPGTSITLNSNNPTNQSTSFDGWSGRWCSGTGACTFTPTDAVTVTANYTLHTNTLTVTKSGTGSGTVTSTDSPPTITCGSTCSAAYPILSTVQLSASPASGSNFIGWSGACTGTGLCTVALSAARTVNAEFEPVPTFTLTIAPGGTGRGTVTSGDGLISCPGTCSHSYQSGTVVTLSETTDNSSFSGWGLGCNAVAPSGQCGVRMLSNTTISPIFTLNTRFIQVSTQDTTFGGASGTVTSSPAGVNCPTTCGASFETGITVTFHAVPDANSTLSSNPFANDGCTDSLAAQQAGYCQLVNGGNPITVYFTHKPVTLNLTFAGTGAGSVLINSSTCTSDCSLQFAYNSATLVGLNPTPAAGSTFASWSGTLGPNCSAMSNPCLIFTAQSDLSVTATFNGIPQTLTVDHGGSPLGDGTISSLPTDINCLAGQCQQGFTNGTVVTLTATPDAATSNFTGWSGACTNTTGTCVVTMAADTSVTANFVVKSRTLAVSKGGFGTGTVTSTTPAGLIACAATCSGSVLNGTSVTLTAAPDAGDSFAGWSGACTNTTGDCTVVMSDDMSVTATFQPPLQQLSVGVATGVLTGTGTVSSDVAGITACASSCSALFPGGTPVTLTATPDPATSTLFGWSGDCTGAQLTCTVTMDQARSVTARFNLIERTLAVTLAGTGAGAVQDDLTAITCGTICSSPYPHGTVVTLTAFAAPGSVFSGWSGACTNSTGTCKVTMDQAQSVTATFNPPPMRTLRVTVAGNATAHSSVSGQGIACGTTCSLDYALGTSVTLTAAVDGVATFTGWTGPCTNPQPATTCTVIVDQDRSVTATFALIPETLSVNVISSNGIAATGSVTSDPPGISCPGTCSADFPIGSTVTLSETPDTTSVTIASSFSQWEGACTNRTGTCTVTMIQPLTAFAAFSGANIRHTLTVTDAGIGIGSVNSSPAGIACGGACSYPFNALTTVTLRATPDTTSSVFSGWTGACAVQLDGTCVVTMDKDYSVTATFSPALRALTVTPSGPGTGTVTDGFGAITCGSTCSASYLNGTSVTLTAAPATGSSFAGWTNSTVCAGTTLICPIVMTADQSVTAHFAANTTTTVASSPTAAKFGQLVTLTATVAPVTAGAGTPTGTVTFTVDSTPHGPFPLSGGTATYSTSSLSVAAHVVTASYTPADSNYVRSTTSSFTTVAVSAAATTITLTQSPNPAPAGSNVTITATVAPTAPGAGVPTGVVVFSTGAKKTVMASVTLVNGVATLTVSRPTAGQVYTATYAGSAANYLGSSASIAVSVSRRH